MWPFKKKDPPSYQPAVAALLDAALEIDIQECFHLEAVNLLESSVATFWMVERVFHALPKDKHEKAGSYAFELFMEGMKREYSPAELKSLVGPLLMKRLDEYSQIFTTNESRDASQALTATAQRIGQRVTGENELHFATTMAIALQWYGSVIAAGKVLLTQDANGELTW
ncbi:hypothetical protein [Rubrivivax gelatinosus]|nr:hypothetical protein [Rubrivivax gelatinosus]